MVFSFVLKPQQTTTLGNHRHSCFLVFNTGNCKEKKRKKEDQSLEWRNGWVVKGLFFCGGPKFDSWHLHAHLLLKQPQFQLTRDPVHSSSLHGHQAYTWYGHTWRQNTHTYKINLKKKSFLKSMQNSFFLKKIRKHYLQGNCFPFTKHILFCVRTTYKSVPKEKIRQKDFPDVSVC